MFDYLAWIFLQVQLLQNKRYYEIFVFCQLSSKFCLSSVKLIEMGKKQFCF